MKRTSKLLALLLAFVMVLGAVVPVAKASELDTGAEVIKPDLPSVAGEDSPSVKTEITKTVTLHKLLLDAETMSAWKSDEIQKGTDTVKGYDGTQTLDQLNEIINDLSIGNVVKEIPNVFFALQNKDGEYIEASMIGGVLTPKDGTQTTKDVSKAGGLTTVSGLKIDTSKLPQTEPTVYKIVEVRELSTYVGTDGKTLSAMKAVPVEITLPLVNQDGIQENVHVYPKNTETGKPENIKKMGETTEITDGKVKLGDTVPYVVTSKIQAGSTYNKLAWSDKLSKGLTLNKDVVLTAKYNDPEEKTLEFKPTDDYTLTYSPDDNSDGFTLVLTNVGLKKLAEITAPTDANFKVNGTEMAVNGKNLAVTFTLNYSAKVNSEAVINNPLENTNTLHYGNNPGYTPEPGDNNPPDVTPKDGKITVDKLFTDKAKAEGITANNAIGWPTDSDNQPITITFELYEYNAKDNSWGEVKQTKTTTGDAVTFENLDNAKQYKVKEIPVDGWVPNYESKADGTVTIVNKKNDNPPPITPEPVIVRTGGKKFVKTNLNGTERLAGAEFIITNSDGNKYLKAMTKEEKDANQQALVLAETAYQNAVKKPESTERIAELKAARDAAAKTAAIQWEWTETKDNAHKFVTNAEGQWGVYGLAYGDYKYIEEKSPEGYADQKTPVKFTVSENSFNSEGNIDYVNGKPVANNTDTDVDESKIQDATQITNKKVTIPQTGGIGTVIFTVAGIAIMAAAAYVLVKNNKKEEETA